VCDPTGEGANRLHLLHLPDQRFCALAFFHLGAQGSVGFDEFACPLFDPFVEQRCQCAQLSLHDPTLGDVVRAARDAFDDAVWSLHRRKAQLDNPPLIGARSFDLHLRHDMPRGSASQQLPNLFCVLRREEF